MKTQQLVQCMVPRALFGGVRNTSKSVYSSDSQLLLSRPSVSGADLKNKYSGISSTDQPGNFASNPARGQLNRENEYPPVLVRA